MSNICTNGMEDASPSNKHVSDKTNKLTLREAPMQYNIHNPLVVEGIDLTLRPHI